MTVEAIVSGQANVALFWEGEALYSLHPGGEPVRRREREIGYLLGDAKDFLHFRGIDRSRVAFELDLEVRRADALHLALMLLDAELEADSRKDAANDLGELFADANVSEFVESVLYSRPLPREAGIRGAIEAARANSTVATFISELVRYQNQIAEAWIAWQGIPDELFARPEERQRALSSAVKSGCFRRLVRRLAQSERVDLFLVEALTNPEVRAVPNHREIWTQWVRPLREESRYPVRRPEALEVAEPAPAFGSDDRRVSIGRGGAFEKAQRQKAAIVDLLAKGDVERAREFVEDLISFHEESGGSAYSSKSLCDLAIQARDLGFEALHLEWSRRATLERPEDGWAWAQYGNALAEEDRSTEAEQAFRNAVVFGQPSSGNNGLADLRKRQGDLEGALEAYDAVLAGDSSDGVAASGRADVLRLLGHLGEALTSYEMVIAEFPRNAYARTGKSKVLQELGRLEEALMSYESVIAEFPRDVYARNGKSEVLRDLGRLDEALMSYESVIAEFPQDLVARNGRAQVLSLLGRWEEALSSLPVAPPTRPQDWIGHHIRGMILARQERLDEARDIFSAGVQAGLPPRQDAYFRNALAAIELRRRRFREAAETLAQVEDGRMALPACMLLLHALGALGRQLEVAAVAERLAAVDLPDGLAELLAELRRRFIQQRPAGRSEEWIWAQELEMLTSVTRIARGFELALLVALRSYRTPTRPANRW